MLDSTDGPDTRSDAPSVRSDKPRGNRARYQSRDRSRPLKVTVTPTEKTAIEAKAQAAGLSVASYLRAAAMGRQMRPAIDYQALGELVKVAGDQGRLGGLLKLWLVDHPGRGAPEIKVRLMLERIKSLQAQLADLVSRV
jgi:hypothetical protein